MPFVKDPSDIGALGVELVAISPSRSRATATLAVARALGVADENSRRVKRAILVVGREVDCTTFSPATL